SWSVRFCSGSCSRARTTSASPRSRRWSTGSLPAPTTLEVAVLGLGPTGLDDEHGALREGAGPAVVVDLDLDDRGAARERHDGGPCPHGASAHRGAEVELELGGGGPVAALDDGVQHRAEDVIDEGGYDTSVEGAEGVEEFGPHVEL